MKSFDNIWHNAMWKVVAEFGIELLTLLNNFMHMHKACSIKQLNMSKFHVGS